MVYWQLAVIFRRNDYYSPIRKVFSRGMKVNTFYGGALIRVLFSSLAN